MRDDDFPVSVKQVLASRVGQRCSNPECQRSTSGPQDDPTKATNIGVAAHITAASPGGPRYDPLMPQEVRRSAENGIWLCQTHAKLIDNDASRYTVTTVREWKRQAEEASRREMEGRGTQRGDGRFTRLEKLIPELLAEMKADLMASPFKREFVLLKKDLCYWASGTEFIYYLEEHPDLDGKVSILENARLVRDVSVPSKHVKRYRISEELVDYLTA